VSDLKAMLRRSFAVERRDGSDDSSVLVDGEQRQHSHAIIIITSIINQLVAQTSILALVTVARVQLNTNKRSKEF